jgi:hypothetical protein
MHREAWMGGLEPRHMSWTTKEIVKMGNFVGTRDVDVKSET